MVRRGRDIMTHIPTRTCVICRKKYPKRELVRMVVAGGHPLVDSTGKMQGRGAYVCRDRECWTRCTQSEDLGNALRVRLTSADRDLLSSFAAGLDLERRSH